MAFLYPDLSIRQHQCQFCTVKTRAPPWHPSSSSVSKPNGSMHHPTPPSNPPRTGTSYSWVSSMMMMMTLKKCPGSTSPKWYHRNISVWDRVSPRMSPKAPWEVLCLFDSEVTVWVSGAAETVDYFG